MAKSNARTGSPSRPRATSVTRGTRKVAASTRTAAPTSRPTDTSERPGAAGVRKKAAVRRAPKLPKAVSGAVRAALDKKAEDLVVLDLRKAGGFTDYFLICTGANARQINAIADGVRETLKREFDERAALTEGVDRSEWILLDYFDFVVHIFSRECRAFYGLERLWGNAHRIDVSEAVRT